MFQLLSFSDSSIIHVRLCCNYEIKAHVKQSDWIIAVGYCVYRSNDICLASMEVSTTSSPTGGFAHIPQLTQFPALLLQISRWCMCTTHHIHASDSSEVVILQVVRSNEKGT